MHLNETGQAECEKYGNSARTLFGQILKFFADTEHNIDDLHQHLTLACQDRGGKKTEIALMVLDLKEEIVQRYPAAVALTQAVFRTCATSGSPIPIHAVASHRLPRQLTDHPFMRRYRSGRNLGYLCKTGRANFDCHSSAKPPDGPQDSPARGLHEQ